jgi:cell division control protein 11
LTDAPPGRTTFVNTLCGKKVLQGKDADDATNAHLEEGVRIKPITVGTNYSCPSNTATNGTAELELDEEGTRISLTIVDTPGFGDQIDNEARSGESPYPKEQLLTCL